MSTHIPVLLPEVTDALKVEADGLYVDATFGLGGYSRCWLEKGARVIAFDRDPAAIQHANALREQYTASFTFHSVPFSQIGMKVDPASVDGIAFDLGVSSPQLDVAARGFSFKHDGPLDMRMSSTGLTAAEIVNTYPAEKLAEMIREFGEERFAGRIARAIETHRAQTLFTTTHQLAAVVRRCVPTAKDGIDPATRTFQGLRIAVNDELGELQSALKTAPSLCKAGGRIAVVSFHSLEDRMVKNAFREASGSIGISRHLPEIQYSAPQPLLKIVTRRAIIAGDAEIRCNPRARSAKLRVAEKIVL